MMGASMFKASPNARLELTLNGQVQRMDPHGASLTLGRAATANLSVNDSRVSRVHCTVDWKGGHFILSDQSSFGTWVYMGGGNTPLVLRRTECYLVGNGLITLGCEREAEAAPRVEFAVIA
jgi:adenylate cyclase